MSPKKPDDSERVLATNRAARHHFHILETFEAGVALRGTEVKSLRGGKANLTDAFGAMKGVELWLHNAHIGPYSHGNLQNHEPLRSRKLLLHKRELRRILGATTRQSMTVIPLRIYLRGSHIKVEIALAKGKKLHDKREDEKRRESDREARAALSSRRSTRDPR